MVGLPTSPPDDPGLSSDQEDMIDVIMSLCEADIFNCVSNYDRATVFRRLAEKHDAMQLDEDADAAQASIDRAKES